MSTIGESLGFVQLRPRSVSSRTIFHSARVWVSLPKSSKSARHGYLERSLSEAACGVIG
jgi:hypothetical protein